MTENDITGNPQLEQLGSLFQAVFPSLRERQDLIGQQHEYWVDQRLHLPRLVPREVADVLPFVLLDLAATAERQRENGDMVLYFLDVWGEAFDPYDPATQALIARFAAEQLDEKEAEQFKALMRLDLRGVGHPLTEAEWAKECREREASFGALTSAQRTAVYEWLRYMDRVFGSTCHWVAARRDVLVSATVYWSRFQ